MSVNLNATKNKRKIPMDVELMGGPLDGRQLGLWESVKQYQAAIPPRWCTYDRTDKRTKDGRVIFQWSGYQDCHFTG